MEVDGGAGGGGGGGDGAPPLPDGSHGLLLSRPVARAMLPWSLTCRRLWQVWRDVRAAAVTAVDVGGAADCAAAAAVVRLPHVTVVSADGGPGQWGAFSSSADGRMPDPVLVTEGLQQWPPGRPGIAAFSMVGAPTGRGGEAPGLLCSLSPRVGAALSSAPHVSSLRRLCLVVGPPAGRVVSLLDAVGAHLTDLTLLMEHDPSHMKPLNRLLAGVGRSMRRLVLNCTISFAGTEASWLVTQCPDLEVLHLLNMFWLVRDDGDGNPWCVAPGTDFMDPGDEQQDVVQDDALGILAANLRLEELVVSACVEVEAPSSSEDGSAVEPVWVTPSPSIAAVGSALAALSPSLQRFGLASCASIGPLVAAFPPLPQLTGLRLDWSTADAAVSNVQLLPAVTALARAGAAPRLADLTLVLPGAVDGGDRAAVAQLNRLTPLTRLRLVCVPHTSKDTWAATVLAAVALPLLAELVVQVAGDAPLDVSIPGLRRRCPCLSSLRIHSANVGLALLQGLSVAGVPSTFVHCTVLPGVTHGWVRHDPLLRFRS